MMDWDLLACWLRQRRKAVVALLVSIVVATVTRQGLNMSSADVELLTAIVTAATVYAVPNEVN